MKFAHFIDLLKTNKSKIKVSRFKATGLNIAIHIHYLHEKRDTLLIYDT